MKGIEGFFSEDEGRWYARFARGLVGGVFVEIGSWRGRSTSFAGPVCKANGTRLVCVDHWGGSNDDLDVRYRAELAREDVEATFRRHMADRAIPVEVLAMTSREASGRFEERILGRIFLDGSHDGASVAEDLALWFPKLSQDGILAGHDYDHKHPELCAAVDAFAAAHGLRVGRGPRSIFVLDR